MFFPLQYHYMNQHLGEIVKRITKEGYSTISAQFSATRQTPWVDFDYLKTYINKGSNVLDLGCGNGRLWSTLRSYQDLRYTGIDANTHFIQAAVETYVVDKDRTNFVAGDLSNIRSLLAQDEQFDVVTMIASFHHLVSERERLELLQWVHDHLRPGGVLFMTNWNLLRLDVRKKSMWRYAVMRVFDEDYKDFLSSRGINSSLVFSFKDVFTIWQSGTDRVLLYYYAFRAGEIERLCHEAGFLDNKSFYAKRGVASRWWNGENLITIAKKT